MAPNPGLSKPILLAVLASLACLPSLAAAAPADSCQTECGWLKFSNFMNQVKECGARIQLGRCRQHAEGHYTSTSPCLVRIDLSPLGKDSRVASVEQRGDSSWSFTKQQSLNFDVNTGIVVERVKLLRPADQCRKAR